MHSDHSELFCLTHGISVCMNEELFVITPINYSIGSRAALFSLDMNGPIHNMHVHFTDVLCKDLWNVLVKDSVNIFRYQDIFVKTSSENLKIVEQGICGL